MWWRQINPPPLFSLPIGTNVKYSARHGIGSILPSLQSVVEEADKLTCIRALGVEGLQQAPDQLRSASAVGRWRWLLRSLRSYRSGMPALPSPMVGSVSAIVRQ